MDWKTQLKLSFDILINGFIFLLLTLLVFYVDPFATMFSSESLVSHQHAVETLAFLNLSKWPLLIPMIGLMLFLINTLLSSRILKPMKKIQDEVQGYIERDFETENAFGKHDYFKQVGSLVDRLGSSLQEDVHFLKQEVVKLREAVEKLEPKTTPAFENAQNALQRISEHFELAESTTEND